MKKFWLYTLEIIIWLCAIYFIAQFSISAFFPQLAEYREYIIKTNDIDGLIVGSPVSLMGMQIGTVSDIVYDEDKILVTMRIRKKGIKLPSKTALAIEGASLGGNRSIELIPKDENFSEENITVTQHKRMITLIKDANEAIEDMIKGYVSMLEMLDTRSSDDLKQKVTSLNQGLDEFQTLSDKVNDEVLLNIDKQPENLHIIKTNMDEMVKNSSDPRIKENIEKFGTCIESIQTQSKCMCDSVQNISADKILEQSQNVRKQSSYGKKVKKENAKEALETIDSASSGINNFTQMLNNFLKSLKKKDQKN